MGHFRNHPERHNRMKEETAGSDFLYPSEMIQNTFLLDYLGGKTGLKVTQFYRKRRLQSEP